MARHTAGKLKQTNKKHKSASATKREQKGSFGPGKVASRVGKKTNHRNLAEESRKDRINRTRQLQKTKRDQIRLRRRVGSQFGPPKIVGLIPLSYAADPASLLTDLLSAASWSNYDPAASPPSPLVHALYAKHKSRCTFLTAEFDMASVLEIVSVCDVLLLVTHAAPGVGPDQIIDETGNRILTAARAVGLPQCVAVVQGLAAASSDGSAKKAVCVEARRLVQRCLENQVLPDIKLLDHMQGQESLVEDLVRSLAAVSGRETTWRSLRSCLVADSLDIGSVGEDGSSCSVRLSGYLRGSPLYIHSLMHLPGVGTARIVRVLAAGKSSGPVEAAARALRRRGGDDDMCGDGNEDIETVEADPSLQDDPQVQEAAPDLLMGEQTWPTEEELAAAQMGEEGSGRARRIVKPNMIPTGMSSYQADWLVDDEGNLVSDEEGEAEGDIEGDLSDGDMDMPPPVGLMAAGGAAVAQAHWQNEAEDDAITLDGSILDVARPLGQNLAEKRMVQARDDDKFPDEIDTPEDVAARVRFARYRALQSFRASPWHAKENLPSSYSRIFEFESFSATQRSAVSKNRYIRQLQDSCDMESQQRARKDSSTRSRASSAAGELALDAEEMGGEQADEQESSILVPGTRDYIKSGQYVTIELSGVDMQALQAKMSQPSFVVTAFSLLQHENKLSVLHFSLQRCGDYDGPIRCKDELIFQTAFREFRGKPIFSESNLNCDKHKMERFLKSDRISVASVFGPITYMPVPVLVYREFYADGDSAENGDAPQRELVATGSLGAVDPDRIMLKKVILTGLPIRVRKRSAVLRHLFYDPQDVRWFKPAELVTKMGLRGHIREPVGTHGLLKASFSAPIKQNDTVMLVLYKRVFPKFPEAGSVVCR